MLCPHKKSTALQTNLTAGSQAVADRSLLFVDEVASAPGSDDWLVYCLSVEQADYLCFARRFYDAGPALTRAQHLLKNPSVLKRASTGEAAHHPGRVHAFLRACEAVQARLDDGPSTTAVMYPEDPVARMLHRAWRGAGLSAVEQQETYDEMLLDGLRLPAHRRLTESSRFVLCSHLSRGNAQDGQTWRDRAVAAHALLGALHGDLLACLHPRHVGREGWAEAEWGAALAAAARSLVVLEAASAAEQHRCLSKELARSRLSTFLLGLTLRLTAGARLSAQAQLRDSMFAGQDDIVVSDTARNCSVEATSSFEALRLARSIRELLSAFRASGTAEATMLRVLMAIVDDICQREPQDDSATEELMACNELAAAATHLSAELGARVRYQALRLQLCHLSVHCRERADVAGNGSEAGCLLSEEFARSGFPSMGELDSLTLCMCRAPALLASTLLSLVGQSPGMPLALSQHCRNIAAVAAIAAHHNDDANVDVEEATFAVVQALLKHANDGSAAEPSLSAWQTAREERAQGRQRKRALLDLLLANESAAPLAHAALGSLCGLLASLQPQHQLSDAQRRAVRVLSSFISTRASPAEWTDHLVERLGGSSVQPRLLALAVRLAAHLVRHASADSDLDTGDVGGWRTRQLLGALQLLQGQHADALRWLVAAARYGSVTRSGDFTVPAILSSEDYVHMLVACLLVGTRDK